MDWQHAIALATQALAVVAGMMLVLWLVHFPLRNASIVDAGWTFGLAFCGSYFAAFGGGAPTRRLAIGTMTLVWGLRLGIYLLTRILGHPEEGRYVELRRKWGEAAGRRFLVFFELQAVSCVLLGIPFLLAALDPEPRLRLIEVVAMGIWAIAIIGETLADWQLARFKANPANRGKVCRSGLWGWSRHPNYFFEWLVWFSYGLFATMAPWGWLGWLAPALMLHFVVNVTGIPPTEEQALRSRGEAYRLYQQEVSAFVPLPPRVS